VAKKKTVLEEYRLLSVKNEGKPVTEEEKKKLKAWLRTKKGKHFYQKFQETLCEMI
jgi:hypothetical protein